MISYTAKEIIDDNKKLVELMQKCIFHERKNVGSLTRPGNLPKLSKEDIWEVGTYLSQLQTIKQNKVYYVVENDDVIIERIKEEETNEPEK